MAGPEVYDTFPDKFYTAVAFADSRHVQNYRLIPKLTLGGGDAFHHYDTFPSGSSSAGSSAGLSGSSSTSSSSTASSSSARSSTSSSSGGSGSSSSGSVACANSACSLGGRASSSTAHRITCATGHRYLLCNPSSVARHRSCTATSCYICNWENFATCRRCDERYHICTSYYGDCYYGGYHSSSPE